MGMKTRAKVAAVVGATALAAGVWYGGVKYGKSHTNTQTNTMLRVEVRIEDQKPCPEQTPGQAQHQVHPKPANANNKKRGKQHVTQQSKAMPQQYQQLQNTWPQPQYQQQPQGNTRIMRPAPPAALSHRYANPPIILRQPATHIIIGTPFGFVAVPLGAVVNGPVAVVKGAVHGTKYVVKGAAHNTGKVIRGIKNGTVKVFKLLEHPFAKHAKKPAKQEEQPATNTPKQKQETPQAKKLDRDGKWHTFAAQQAHN